MNLTVEEVAKDLRCAPKTVRAMCADKRLAPTFKVGREYRIPARTLASFTAGEPARAMRPGAWRPHRRAA